MKYIIAEKKNNVILELFEYLYLITIYYYSFSTLNSSIIAYNDYENPNFLLEYFPLLEKLTEFGIGNNFNFITDRSIFLYFILVDIIRRPIIPFSRIVKFNLILLFLIEFSFLIISSSWDIFLVRDINISQFNQFKDNKNIHDIFYSIIWVVYVIIYSYCAFFAFQKKYPVFFAPFDKITPSIHFHLNKKKGTYIK